MSGVLSAFVGGSYGFKPINTVAPVVSGTANVGSGLSTTNGTWTTAPPITSYSYQWFRSPSTAITGATTSSYTLVLADAGSTIYCIVTANNPVGSVPANSNTTAVVRNPVAISIGADVKDYVLNTAKVASYAAGFTDVTLNNYYAYIGASSTSTYAFTVNTSWAAGDTIRVINYGQIMGAGGDGGAGGGEDADGSPGAGGGYAMLVSRPITFSNIGLVGSGGGGGGGGGSYNGLFGDSPGGGGGGGAGSVPGFGGAGGVAAFGPGYPGGAGSASGGGAGGAGVAPGANGSAGGFFGAAGTAGSASSNRNGGAGGAAGYYALVGVGNVNGGAGLGGTVYGVQG